MTKNPKKIKTMRNIKDFAIVFCASLISAVALELFLIPSHAIVGGASGIAILLDLVTDDVLYFSPGIWIVAINIPILIYCFMRLKRRFAVKTLVYVVCLGGLLFLFRATHLAELLKTDGAVDNVSNRVVFTLIGGGLQGVSLPLMISVNASTGGTDIVGLILQKRKRKTGSQSMRYILLSNVVILIVASIIVGVVNGDVEQGITVFVYSIAAMFVAELVQEQIYHGFSSAYELEVTTSKVEEVSEALKEELKHGVTIFKGEGGYSRQDKFVITCVINRRQVTRAKKVVRQADPESFAYVVSVREVVGLGFSNKDAEIEEEINIEETK